MSSVYFLPFAQDTRKRQIDYRKILTLEDSVQIFVVPMRYWLIWSEMNNMVADQKKGTGQVGISSATKHSKR